MVLKMDIAIYGFHIPSLTVGGVTQPCARLAGRTHDLCYSGHKLLQLVRDPQHCHIDNIDMRHNFVQHHVAM